MAVSKGVSSNIDKLGWWKKLVTQNGPTIGQELYYDKIVLFSGSGTTVFTLVKQFL